MAEGTFNWCFIGTGSMARTAARQMAFTRSKSHRIVSAYSLSRESTDKFTLWFGGKSYDTLEEAVSADGVDAVYIATPHSTHFDIAMKCIELHKPVLVEKPFTLNTSQCEKLFEAAEKNNVFISEAMWTWFSPIAQKVREWVTTGEIGDVKTVDIKYAMGSSKFYKAPRLFDKSLGGGALLDIGVFPITYCFNLFGYPSKIECVGDINDDGIDEGERIKFEYDNGVICNISVSLTNYEGRENAIVTGTDGVITIPLFHQAVKASLMSNTKRETTRTFTTFMTEFDTTADEIRSNKLTSEVMPKENIISVMKIMDECRQQMGVKYPGE